MRRWPGDRHDGHVTGSGRPRGVALATAVALTCVVVLAARVAAGAVLPGQLLVALPALVPVALGWLIARHTSAGPVGSALAWIGAGALAVDVLPDAWAATRTWPGAGLVDRMGPEGFWAWQLLPLVWLLTVFPSGRLPGRRWALLASAAPAGAVVVTGCQAVWGGEATPPAEAWAPLLSGFCLLLVGLGGALAGLVVRHRRGSERTRLQLRWLTLAGCAVLVLLPAGWAAETLGASVAASYTGFLLALLVLVPAAVAVAIVRHDLFDVERLLGGTLAWLTTTATAAGIFAALVLLGGELAGERLGVTGAAFLTALCLVPLHRRLERSVGRVVDRDATVRLERVRLLVERVRDGHSEPEEVEEVLRSALGDPAVRLLLHAPGQAPGGVCDLRGHAAAPRPGAPGIPLSSGRTEVGVLELGDGSARRVRRAREAVAAAWLPIEMSRLRLQLRRALADVHASRARLVVAGAEERRRLERDLHDGAQAQIVAVAMRLQTVQRRLGPDSPGDADLGAAVQALEGTLAELRRLAHGVRPSRLDDGLSAALAHLVRDSAVPVELVVEDAPLPDLAAVTAYYVVAESVANATKHAGATRIAVAVRVGGGRLHVTVSDDGVGGAQDGFGLTSLRDRVGSAGGRITVDSPAGSGTTVTAVIPCGS